MSTRRTIAALERRAARRDAGHVVIVHVQRGPNDPRRVIACYPSHDGHPRSVCIEAAPGESQEAASARALRALEVDHGR